MNDELMVQSETPYMSVAQVKQQMLHVQEILREVLVEGKVLNGKIVKDGHYSKLPGCGDRKVLLKPGAEKLCLAFNLVPKYEINILPIPENEITPPGHRDYEVTCELYSRASGNFVGQGMGSCTTMEGKYRYRTKWINKQPLKEENSCLADIYNTVKKMACKRALVHAVIQCLAVGDIFIQDVEDMKPEDINSHNKPKPPMTPPKSKSADLENSSWQSNGITKNQNGAIFALFGTVMNETGKDVIRERCSAIVKITNLESMKDLTFQQASDIIDHLNSMKEN